MAITSLQQMTDLLTNTIRGNSAAEARWVAAAPPELQGAMIAQIQMQREQELMEMLAQMMKEMGEAGKTVRRNIGG